MPTTRFNGLVIDVARRLQEPKVEDAGYLTGTFSRYSAALISSYVNNAIREIVRDVLKTSGKAFPEIMPEMIKNTAPLALTNGALSRPSDFLYGLSMVSDAGNILFRYIPGRSIGEAISGIDPAIVGTADEPIFYEEGDFLRTKGITSGSVVLRYVRLHEDIVISVAAAGNGKLYTGADSVYTAATKTLQGTFTPALAVGDERKHIMFYDNIAGKVHHARITSYVDATHVTLEGDDLPVADIAQGDITIILISDLSPDTSDIVLKPDWNFAIIERAVSHGIADARRLVLQQEGT